MFIDERYPSQVELNDWIESIWSLAESAEGEVEVLSSNGFSHSLGVNHVGQEFRYVLFRPKGLSPFYAYWQPAYSSPAPLLVHVPGYGAEISTHPDLVEQGYNVLHVSPLGYATPEGPDESKKRDGDWPVLQDTILTGAMEGYRHWLANVVIAVNWAMSKKEVINERVSFFGTSQGGGGALLLGSIYKGKGVRCVAADLPFLTNFTAVKEGAYRRVPPTLEQLSNIADGWRALGFIDTLSHASRLDIPILLTGGGLDDVCPPETVETLFEALPGTKCYFFLKEGVHRYSREFITLTSSWFRLYA